MAEHWYKDLMQELRLITISIQESQAIQLKRISREETTDIDGKKFQENTHDIIANLFSQIKQELGSSSTRKIEREIVFRASMNYISKQILSKYLQSVQNKSKILYSLPKTDYDYLNPSQEVQDKFVELFKEYKLKKLSFDQLGEIYKEVLKLCDQQNPLGAFYTPRETVEYMVSRLDLKSDSKVFDPACGNGNFLESCTTNLKKRNLDVGYDELKANQKAIEQVWGNDIDPYAVLLSIVRIFSLNVENQSLENLNITNLDALEIESWNIFKHGEEIDCIIGNPPYGISPSLERREMYKTIYRDEANVYGYKLGGNDLFGFFLASAIKIVKNGGRICFIGTDTFLSLRTHRNLRQLILNTCKIDEILLAPINLFRPMTTSRTCIITLTKQLCKNGYNHSSNPTTHQNKRYCNCTACYSRRKSRIRLINRLYNQSEYFNPSDNKVQIINQEEYDYINGNPFWINVPPKIIQIMRLANLPAPDNIQEGWKYVELRKYIGGGEGISTGDNSSHLVIIENSRLWKKLMKKRSKKLDRFRVLDEEKIFDSSSLDEKTLEQYRYHGIEGDQFLVPFERGSYIPYWGSEGWYIDWSVSSVLKIKKRAKESKGRRAVFRNPHLYFHSGIITDAHHGILKATLTEKTIPAGNTNLFFGLGVEIEFLLGYLNSKLASYLLGKIINTSLGGMSGHVTPENIKRLPLLLPTEKNSKIFDELKGQVIHLTRKIISKLKFDLNTDYSKEKSQIDNLILKWFNLGETEIVAIDNYVNQVKVEKLLY
ncbi:MAG: N-6 DNA methylase [Candidatus Heimdallarchaeota archaeon]|nr:MAG: N-6 DNA methylase [Candidatus Heimdallarchaeota archaeon]